MAGAAGRVMLLRGSFSPALRPGLRPGLHRPPGPRFAQPGPALPRYRRFSPISPLRPLRPPPPSMAPQAVGQRYLPPPAPPGHLPPPAPGAPRHHPPAPPGAEEPPDHRRHLLEEAPLLMKETRLVAATRDHTVGVKTGPEALTLTCSDLLSAYRLSQNITRSRSGAYKYDPSDTVDVHRRLTVNSRRIFEKLSSPRKENKGPYVPNRDIMKLFTNTPEAREREQLAMENEEFLHRHKRSRQREGEFFSAQNPDMLEKFQTTHEYIKNVYRHSKENLPPVDDMKDVHDRVKHFCGVKNEELLEKLKVIEDRVRSQEWSGRVKDTREKMSKLYDENREFLARMKERQEKRMNDVLEDNKELIESIKAKAAETKETVEIKSREFDQMMEKTVCEAI